MGTGLINTLKVMLCKVARDRARLGNETGMRPFDYPLFFVIAGERGATA
jgi:hypothetical protein